MTEHNQAEDQLTPEILRELLTDAEKRDRYGITLGEACDLVPLLGEEVFTLFWDTGAPAGTGVDRVYRLAGQYLKSTAILRWRGLFGSLDEACGPIRVTSSTKEIWSSEWDDDETIVRLELHSPGPFLQVNGTRWPLETLEHRHEQLWRERLSDGPGASAADEGPELFMWPVAKNEDGNIFRASAPAAPDHIPAAELREAAVAALAGEIALEPECRDAPLAELRFREALSRYREALVEPHPRLSYILDRIGLACHLQGRVAEAEFLYRRSLKVLAVQDAPTRWNDITLLNLAVLLGCQGRTAERDAVMELYRA